MKYNELTTLTGVPLTEVGNRLADLFDDDAFAPISGGSLGRAGLTDINVAHVHRRAEEVFGLLGTGWRYTISSPQIVGPDDGVEKPIVVVMLNLQYRYSNKEGEWCWSEPIPHTGANDNRADFSEAFKGAVTNAIKGVFSRLRLQEDVYMGKYKPRHERILDTVLSAKPEDMKDAVKSFNKDELTQIAKHIYDNQLGESAQYEALIAHLRNGSSAKRGVGKETTAFITEMAKALSKKYVANGVANPVAIAQHLQAHYVEGLNDPPFEPNGAAQWISVVIEKFPQAVDNMRGEIQFFAGLREAVDVVDVVGIVSKYTGTKHRDLETALANIKPGMMADIWKDLDDLSHEADVDSIFMPTDEEDEGVPV